MYYTAKELIEKGREAIRKSDPIAAKDFFRKATETDPQSLEAKVELARMEAVTGNLIAAGQLLDQALKLRPDHAMAHAMLGTLKTIQREFDSAIPILEKAIRIDPHLSFAHLNLGIAQRELGLLDAAETSIRKAIDEDKNNFEAYYALAHTLCVKEKIEEGILAALKSVEINPRFVKGYRVLGTLYTMAGKPQIAERLYDECLQHVPQAIAIRDLLVRLYLTFGKTEAAQLEMEVLAQQRGSLSDWLLLGNLCVLNKKPAAGAIAFQRATKVAAHAWEPHYNLGDLYDSSNFNELAGKEYELAVQLNSGSFKPHNGMGLWLLKQNRTSEAIEQLQRACEIDSTAIEPAYNLALAFIQANKSAEARGVLSRLNTSDSRVSELRAALSH